MSLVQLGSTLLVGAAGALLGGHVEVEYTQYTYKPLCADPSMGIFAPIDKLLFPLAMMDNVLVGAAIGGASGVVAGYVISESTNLAKDSLTAVVGAVAYCFNFNYFDLVE